MTATGITRDFQVIEFASVGIQVQGEGAITGFQFASTAAGGGCAAVAQFARAVNAFDGFGGDAVVEGVDHAADGVAAVQQGRRAAHDFDALNVDRVQWHRVIVRQ